MQVWQTVAIGVAILVIAAVAWYMYQRNRTQHLQNRFGPEYDRRIAQLGSRRRAESELAHRESAVEKIKVRPLNPSDRVKFFEEWRLTQAEFVDDPAGAVNHADRLVTDIMRTRGYSVDDPYDRVADVCAAYPDHAQSYRDANDIVVRHRRVHASTEDLRAAFVKFRALFDEMLGGQDEELKRAS
jgi:hypothetical protein